MDSTQVALPEGSKKLQGVPIWKIVEAYPESEKPEAIIFRSNGDEITLTWSEIQNNDDLRIFSVIEPSGISFVLAEISGDVLLFPLTEMEID